MTSIRLIFELGSSEPPRRVFRRVMRTFFELTSVQTLAVDEVNRGTQEWYDFSGFHALFPRASIGLKMGGGGIALIQLAVTQTRTL